MVSEMKFLKLRTDLQIGKYFRDLRELREIKLKDAAKKLGMSANFLCELEQGKKRWLWSDAVKYMTLLNRYFSKSESPE